MPSLSFFTKMFDLSHAPDLIPWGIGLALFLLVAWQKPKSLLWAGSYAVTVVSLVVGILWLLAKFVGYQPNLAGLPAMVWYAFSFFWSYGLYSFAVGIVGLLVLVSFELSQDGQRVKPHYGSKNGGGKSTFAELAWLLHRAGTPVVAHTLHDEKPLGKFENIRYKN